MNKSVCFHCGSDKHLPLSKCDNCGNSPNNKTEQVQSLILSEHISTLEKLNDFSQELKNHRKAILTEELILRAIGLLKDPQLFVKLGVVQSSSVNADPKPTENKIPHAEIATENNFKIDSYLHKNPFFTLGITTRDNRKKIVEAAEEMSLDIDHEVCQNARSTLINPRSRLTAELSWLPGVSPRKAEQLVELTSTAPSTATYQL